MMDIRKAHVFKLRGKAHPNAFGEYPQMWRAYVQGRMYRTDTWEEACKVVSGILAAVRKEQINEQRNVCV